MIKYIPLNKSIFFSLALILILLSCKASPHNSAIKDSLPHPAYKLIWNDEFNGKALDKKKWGLLVKGKRGDAFHTLSAVHADGKGNIVIKASISNDTVTTAIIHTQKIFETLYGYFECRAKLPAVNGAWPAFWLQSTHNGNGGTPEKNGVEIDIFEYFHHIQKDKVLHTLHWSGYGSEHKVVGPVYSDLKKTKDGFHTFGLEWTPDYYATYVDGVKTNESTAYISRMPEFLLLSVEVDKKVAGPLDTKKLPALFIIDYVRVYKK